MICTTTLKLYMTQMVRQKHISKLDLISLLKPVTIVTKSKPPKIIYRLTRSLVIVVDMVDMATAYFTSFNPYLSLVT